MTGKEVVLDAYCGIGTIGLTAADHAKQVVGVELNRVFDQNVALTAGEPANASEMLALNIYNTFYGRSGAQWKGIGQAKAVVFFLIVVVISLIQLHFTRSKEVQQ